MRVSIGLGVQYSVQLSLSGGFTRVQTVQRQTVQRQTVQRQTVQRQTVQRQTPRGDRGMLNIDFSYTVRINDIYD